MLAAADGSDPNENLEEMKTASPESDAFLKKSRREFCLFDIVTNYFTLLYIIDFC